MRVLHLTRPAAGGVVRFLQHVIPQLERLGVTCEIACPQSMHPLLSPFTLRRWEIADRWHLLGDLHCARQAVAWQREFDLLHTHGLRAVAVLGMMPPSRWVFTLHNLPPPHLTAPARWLLSRASRSARRIYAVSEAVRTAWMQHFPQAESKCEVTPGGVALDSVIDHSVNAEVERRQWNLPALAPVALCVARLMEDKGIDVLLKALVYVPAWFALIVGEGPQRAALEQLASELGVGDRVRFTGYLPHLYGVLAVCDVAVVPSRREGLGLFALEAMASGKPVIASDIGGLRETVRHNETGWLVPAEDVKALADALQHALNAREQLPMMGVRGAEWVRANYTWEQTAQRLFESYRRLVRM